MARSKSAIVAIIVGPSLLLAAIGTWFVHARGLEANIGYPLETIFLTLFLGSVLGLAVVYYAFQLDVKSGH